MFHPTLLEDKRILITGGGTGLGLAMAHKFASLGADVAICGRREHVLAEAAEQLRGHGNEVLTFACDVRDPEAVHRMFDYLDNEWEDVNGLVNNAAGNFLCLAEDVSYNGFKTVIDIVLMGTFNCSHQFGKRLLARKRPGTAISIVTTYTHSGCAFVLPSACAKAAVETLTNTLAFEWGGQGIRFNAIAPGPFPTDGAWSRLMPDEAFQELYLKGNPLGRVGNPDELGHLAAFLMSDLSGYINGETIAIDGGQRHQGAEFSQFIKFGSRDQLRQIFQAMRGKEK
jgi:NAD(P)-dependent dehydrogenase (short-subunit alcohol dehydrogenase family)